MFHVKQSPVDGREGQSSDCWLRPVSLERRERGRFVSVYLENCASRSMSSVFSSATSNIFRSVYSRREAIRMSGICLLRALEIDTPVHERLRLERWALVLLPTEGR